MYGRQRSVWSSKPTDPTRIVGASEGLSLQLNVDGSRTGLTGFVGT